MDRLLSDGPRYKAWVTGQRVNVRDKDTNELLSEFAGSGSKEQYKKVARKLSRRLNKNRKKGWY